jgi:spore coat polysaccharide biosynthesis protein SpsF (cytidylyltransferase family)
MSNETKQTAVEWLLDRIEDVDLTEKLWENVKQQAKEMEKEQIEDAELRSKEIIIIKHTEHEGGKK